MKKSADDKESKFREAEDKWVHAPLSVDAVRVEAVAQLRADLAEAIDLLRMTEWNASHLMRREALLARYKEKPDGR